VNATKLPGRSARRLVFEFVDKLAVMASVFVQRPSEDTTMKGSVVSRRGSYAKASAECVKEYLSKYW